MSKRFLVALSFPGEKREFVEAVANAVAEVVGEDRVLYDHYLHAEFARPNLDLHLGHLYHDESELIVPFFSADYERKEWCGLEWRQIRDLAKQRKDEQIMPFRFDDTPIPGVLSIDGYVAVKDRSPRQVAEMILERLALIGAAPKKERSGATREATTKEPLYFLFACRGEAAAGPEDVFYLAEGNGVAQSLARIFTREYGNQNLSLTFHFQAAENFTVDDRVLLNEALDGLRVYDDPDRYIYDPPPSEHTMERAQFSRRADAWLPALCDLLSAAKPVASDQPKGAAGGAASNEPAAGMLPEEKRNACLNLLMMLAQVYYKLLECSVGGPCGEVDLELNQSYFWTVSSLTKLLAHDDFKDFREQFSPMFPDLYPTTLQDIDWQDMVAPHAELLLSTVQRYTIDHDMQPPEEQSPGWCFVELYRPSITSAISRAEAYRKRMREYWQQVLKNASAPQKSEPPAASSSRQPSTPPAEETLAGFRGRIGAAARKVLTRIWNDYLTTGDWPEIISIHADLDKAKVTRLLEPLDRVYVRSCNCNSRGKRVYELTLLGVLCTERGTKYLGFLERYLNFLRDLHYGGKRPDVFDYPTLVGALNLAPEEGKELGRIIQAGFLFAGGGTGKEPEKWTFTFPDEADDLPRKKSVRPWVEKFVLKRSRPPPVVAQIGYIVPPSKE